MKLAVVGAGLVSAIGLGLRDHAFFPPARVPPPPPATFFDVDDARVPVVFCPWIGAHRSIAERWIEMAIGAALEASAPVREAGLRRVALVVGVPSPRPGVAPAHIDAVEAALRATLSPTRVVRVHDEAGVFRALADGEALLATDDAVLFVGVDSFVDPDAVHAVLRARGSWEPEGPAPGEGAAAIAFVPAHVASRGGLRALGVVDAVSVLPGVARDDNDDPIDASALTSVLARTTGGRPRFAYGQSALPMLRLREWSIASARLSERFDPALVVDCIEGATGLLGAASGVGHLAFALGAALHGVHPKCRREEVMLAWAIGRDGLRGAAALRTESP